MATTEEALHAMRVQREQLPEVLRVLAQHRGVKTYEMAAAIEVSSPSMSSRLHGKVVILQHEVPALAAILDVPEEVLRLSPDVALRWSREHPRKVDRSKPSWVSSAKHAA